MGGILWPWRVKPSASPKPARPRPQPLTEDDIEQSETMQRAHFAAFFAASRRLRHPPMGGLGLAFVGVGPVFGLRFALHNLNPHTPGLLPPLVHALLGLRNLCNFLGVHLHLEVRKCSAMFTGIFGRCLFWFIFHVCCYVWVTISSCKFVTLDRNVAC